MKAEKARTWRLPIRTNAIGAPRDVPLSLLFAALMVNCGEYDGGGTCGHSGPSEVVHEEVLIASEADYEYFAKSDGILDSAECFALCSCLASSFSLSGVLDAGTALDADATIDPGSDGGDADDAADDSDASDDGGASDGGQTTDAAEAAHLMLDSGTAAPRCNTVKRGYARLTWCADRGATAQGHNIACGGVRGVSGPVCGRGGACHLHLGRGLGKSAVARWLAFAAATEAASIRSFTTLGRELHELGAPANFVRRAQGAARDEAKHARLMRRLAHRWGGKVVPPQSGRLPARDLEAVATENAVEGCVRETWAALLNHHQAAHATDAEVRRAMAPIARDETAHAELAHDIDRWAMTQLSRSGRERLIAARGIAVQTLVAELREPTRALRTVLGLPSMAVQQALARGLGVQLWS